MSLDLSLRVTCTRENPCNDFDGRAPETNVSKDRSKRLSRDLFLRIAAERRRKIAWTFVIGDVSRPRVSNDENRFLGRSR